MRTLLCSLLPLSAQAGGFSVGAGGQPSADLGIAVPPGVAGMTPILGLEYSEGATAGVAGAGWSVQGVSVVTRCSASRAVDGLAKGVAFVSADKLCLNGQRLIQTDASGNPLSRSQQVADAAGIAGGSPPKEYRTETDSYSRIRAYGMVSADIANGPAYFKVWTKGGQVLEFGTNPGGDANAQVLASGKTAVAVWAVSRISDAAGNFIDFKYDQRSVPWGSGPTPGSPQSGLEWGFAEVQYAGNKVVLQYEDRPSQAPADSSETYHAGSKTVNRQRLKYVTTYVNSPNTSTRGPGAAAAPVKTYKLIYTASAITGRSLLSQWQDCAGGPTSVKCLPATSFAYAAGRDERLAVSASFKSTPLATRRLTSLDGTYGTFVADFNGDGRSDILRWAVPTNQNELWLSNGDGTFSGPTGSSSNLFNLNGQVLFTADGCWTSVVQDVNGDGLPDIVRIPASVNNTGGACTAAQVGMIFINNGDESFTSRPITTADGTPIPLNRITSRKLTQNYCGSIAALDAGMEFMAQLITNVVSNCRRGYGWTEGASYYFIDVNGDGKLDIVTSYLAAYPLEDPGNGGLGSLISQINCSACTKVYIANANGTFDLQTSNLNNVVVYADPGNGSNLAGFRNVMDADLDGLPDLVGVGTPLKKQSWASNGTGNFTAVTSPSSCDVMLDFNGDGKADCLQPDSTAASNYLSVATGLNTFASVGNFSLGSSGSGLSSNYSLAGGANFGVIVADLDGDHRHDLIRWHDDKFQNIVYLSNGDGTFRASTVAFVETGPIKLKHSSGAYDMLLGDFTGRGFTEILRVSDVASTQVGDDDKNLLLVSGSSANSEEDVDSLAQIASASGLTTTLTRQRLTSANGNRYRTDRGTSNAAGGTKVDLLAGMPVVVTSESMTGIGSATVKTEFAYRGLKVDTAGRGMLGFREFRQQGVAPNGEYMTSVTQHAQDFPYTGMPLLTRSYRGALLDDSVAPLTVSTVTYCDTSSTSTPPAAVPDSVTPPCLAYTTSAAPVIYRPYARQKLERAWDLARGPSDAPLTTTTSTFSYDSFGNALSITSETKGTSAGIQQTNTQTTSNIYFQVNLDNWILGRLQAATVSNTVPSNMPTTGAGNSSHAADRVGSGPAPAPAPMNPGVLAAILQLLQDD